ncbi:MAG: MmoB/DmpM family protein [Kangiellaceae bacterium]|nr:MmoB/DmpM family protein [Kangiellaceae bacterium]
MSRIDDILNNNDVGPVLMGGPVAQAVIEAAEIDNPEKEISVEDKGAYVRVSCSDEMFLRQETISEALGREFEIQELEVSLGSFAGRIESHDDYVRFFFNKSV